MILPVASVYRSALLLCSVALVATLNSAAQAQDIGKLEEQAVREAVAKAAPSTVRIEVIGGFESVGGDLANMGPSTGLIVSEDGYIITSSFNFLHNPTSMVVTLPSGKRLPAKRVATDENCQLVLLKVNTDEKLPVPDFVPLKDVRIAQSTIAIGRTYEEKTPNISLGIVSAKGRIMGKAIQTDAKISPSNYGGPIIDIYGRVLGVLVPFATMAGDNELYDAGIGFAVPLETIMANLDKMKGGKDLKAGLLGINLKPGDPRTEPAEIASSPITSPAMKAGLKAGDVIVKFGDRDVENQMQLRLAIGPRYAGETVRVVAKRPKEGLVTKDVLLVGEVEPFPHSYLGILPDRSIGKDKAAGVKVRFVYPDSPAAKAELKAGDVITKINGKAVANNKEARELLAGVHENAKVKIDYERDGQAKTAELQSATLPTTVPAILPAPRAKAEAFAGKRPTVGWSKLKLPEFANTTQLYVPESYNPDLTYGVVLWLHGATASKQEELKERWQALCDDNDLILVAPNASNAAGWSMPDATFLRKAVDKVAATYKVDPTRVIAHGHNSGGAMACLMAIQNRDLFTGVSPVDPPIPAGFPFPRNDSLSRLAVFTATPVTAAQAAQFKAALDALRKEGFPVTVIDQGKEPRYFNQEEMAHLVRWIDSLDRL